MPIFPTSIRKRLRYADYFEINSGSGGIGNYIFRANSLYDPNFTGTGHQPMGYDQLMTFFDHYIVVNARCVVRFMNVLGSNAAVYLRVDGNNASLSSREELLETGGIVSDVLSANGTPGSNKVLTLDFNIPKYHGVSDTAVTSMDSLQGDITASPSDGIYFHCGCFDQYAGGAAQVAGQVLIEFDAIFTEPRVPSLSRNSEITRQNEIRKARKSLHLEEKKSTMTLPQLNK